MDTTRPYHRSELRRLWDLKGQGPQGSHRHFSGSVTWRASVVGGYQDLHFLLLQPDLHIQSHSLPPKLTSPLAPSSPATVQNPALGQSAHQPPGLPLCQEPEKKCKVGKGTQGGTGVEILASLPMCCITSGSYIRFGSAGSSSLKEKNKTHRSDRRSIFKRQRHGKLSLTAFVGTALTPACPLHRVAGNSMK